MANSFSAQVNAFIAKSEQRMVATLHGAAQDLAEGVTKPVAKGGNMRVKTGFLRASLMASTSAMPLIDPNAKPPSNAADDSYDWDSNQVNLVIAGSDIGQTIYFGFTASYARYREYEDGFVRLAAQRWQQIVDANAAKAIKAYP